MSTLAPNCNLICKEMYPRDCQHHQQQQISSGFGLFLLKSSGFGLDCRKRLRDNSTRLNKRTEIRASSLWSDLSKPSSAGMESIKDCDDFDRVLQLACDHSQPIVIDWIKFYRVDVNNVPQALVKRGNISKMPTIQLWKDGEMKAEVIGGHKAWLVMEEVREMIKQFI